MKKGILINDKFYYNNIDEICIIYFDFYYSVKNLLQFVIIYILICC